MALLLDGPPEGRRLVLAHGAGAPMDSAWLNQVCSALGQAGLRVVRFEFPYMGLRREGGPKRAPDREPVLRSTWMEVIKQLGDPGSLVIGGKSMGGRIASMVLEEAGVAGGVCLGYPFHPPGRPEKLRTAHLAVLQKPLLIVQGTRDPFGTAEEVPNYPLSPAVRVVWAPDGDHSLEPRARSGHTWASTLKQVVREVQTFVAGL